MKRVIIENQLDVVDVSKVSIDKIYAGRHTQDRNAFAIIIREDFNRGNFKPVALHIRLTDCNGWNAHSTLRDCITQTSHIKWFEFNNFEEVCEWYLTEIKEK